MAGGGSTPGGHKGSSGGMTMSQTWSRVVARPPGKVAKNLSAVHLKWVKFMICKIYLNEAGFYF